MPLIGRKERLVGNASVGIPNRSQSVRTPATINGGKANLPRMDQIGGADPLSFVFPFGINNISHDVGAVQFDELQRPLSLPILQPTASSLQRVSFDFLVAAPFDGVSQDVEEELRVLQNFAAEDNSVIFVNSHEMLTQSVASWKISSLSVSISRQNELGAAVSAQVNMSCLESNDMMDRFLTLPKFRYKVNKNKGSGKPGDTPPGGDSANTLINTFFLKTKDAFAEMDSLERAKLLAGLNRLAVNYGEDTVVQALKAYSGDYGKDYLFNALSNKLALNAKKEKNN